MLTSLTDLVSQNIIEAISNNYSVTKCTHETFSVAYNINVQWVPESGTIEWIQN